MQNVNEGRSTEAAIKQTSAEVGEANCLAVATEEHIVSINANIASLNEKLQKAENELDRARYDLRQKTRRRDFIRLWVCFMSDSLTRIKRLTMCL